MLGHYQDRNITKNNANALSAAMARLEAERFDVSYKDFRPKPQASAELSPGEKRVLEDDLIAKGQARRRTNSAKKLEPKTIWDAGRFAAGARDTEAIQANKVMRENR